MRLHLALSLIVLASLLPALPSATAAAAAPPGSTSGEECYASAVASTEVCVYEHWSTGDTCVAIHRGEWVHVTRCVPVDQPRCPGDELDAVDLPCSAPTAGASPTVCTYHLVESVAACAGTDGCVTVYVGPSSTTRCVQIDVADLPPVCTGHLIESVQVCENADGCLAAYLGPREFPLCVETAAIAPDADACRWIGPVGVCTDGSVGRGCLTVWFTYFIVYHECWMEASASASAASAGCTSWRPLSVCTWSEGSGNCVGVYANRAEIVHECFMLADQAAVAAAPAALAPATSAPSYPCVFVDVRTSVCAYRNGDGEQCVYGEWEAHPIMDQCLGRAQAGAQVARCVEPIANLEVCHWTASNGATCVGVYVSYSSYERCVQPAIDVARCVEPIANLEVCRWTGSNGEACVGVYVSYSSYERCVSPRVATAEAGNCVILNRDSEVCRYSGSDGSACVGGTINRRPFEQCLSPRASPVVLP